MDKTTYIYKKIEKKKQLFLPFNIDQLILRMRADDDLEMRDLFFQQDGVPPNYAKAMPNALKLYPKQF